MNLPENGFARKMDLQEKWICQNNGLKMDWPEKWIENGFASKMDQKWN